MHTPVYQNLLEVEGIIEQIYRGPKSNYEDFVQDCFLEILAFPNEAPKKAVNRVWQRVRREHKHVRLDKDPLVKTSSSSFPMLDDFLRCCRSDRERQVIRLRSEGHSDNEIAKILDIPRRSVSRIRKKLEERYHTCVI